MSACCFRADRRSARDDPSMIQLCPSNNLDKKEIIFLSFDDISYYPRKESLESPRLFSQFPNGPASANRLLISSFDNLLFLAQYPDDDITICAFPSRCCGMFRIAMSEQYE
jgi:hypothetical protein